MTDQKLNLPGESWKAVRGKNADEIFIVAVSGRRTSGLRLARVWNSPVTRSTDQVAGVLGAARATYEALKILRLQALSGAVTMDMIEEARLALRQAENPDLGEPEAK